MFSCKNLIVIVIAMYLVLYVLKDDTSKMVVGGATLFFLYNNELSLREGLESDDPDSSLELQAELVDTGSSIVGNNTVSSD